MAAGIFTGFQGLILCFKVISMIMDKLKVLDYRVNGEIIVELWKL